MAGRIGVVPGAIQVGNRRQALAAPGGAVPGLGSQQGFAAALHPRNIANQGELLSHGKLTHGYVMHHLRDENAGTLIRMGQQLFIRKDADTFTEAGAQSADNQPHHIVNLWMENTGLRAGTRAAMEAFREVQATDPGNEYLKVNSCVRALHSLCKQMIREPEERQAYLYADGVQSKVYEHPLGKHAAFCSQVGQRTRWNPLGVSLAHSAADTQTHNDFVYLPINVGFRGVFKMENVWGAAAAPGSNLFYIHKRIQDPFTKRWDFIGWQPYATIEEEPPLSARQYIDFGGNKAYGTVYYAGMVSDSLGEALEGEALLKLQGLHPQCSSQEEHQVGKDVPMIDVIYQAKRHGKYFNPY